MASKKRKTHKASRLGRLLAMLPVTCILLYPLYLAGKLDLDERQYYHAALPAAFDGLRIVYLSDIHYGTYLKEQRVQDLVRRVNALNPDVIILGGDYGEDSQGALDFFALQPHFEANICVVAVVGNHDRTVPDKRINDLKAAMQSCGITPLVNDVLVLSKQNSTLALAGLDDFYNGFPDLKSVAHKAENAEFTIFLPHTPDLIPEVYEQYEKPFYQLALCGHTHGGQVSFFGYAPFSSSNYGNRYLSGWFHENGTDILVSNGVGTSWLPVRLGARPQFHLITLRAGQQP